MGAQPLLRAQRPQRRQVILQALPALGAAALGFAIFLGGFVLIFGTQRFLADFWPLDSSRVGPNLVASMVLTVLLVLHNEYVTVRNATHWHEQHRQLLTAVLTDALHPTEKVEEDMAQAIEEHWRQQVLDLLDTETDGGLGKIKQIILLPKEN